MADISKDDLAVIERAIGTLRWWISTGSRHHGDAFTAPSAADYENTRRLVALYERETGERFGPIIFENGEMI